MNMTGITALISIVSLSVLTYTSWRSNFTNGIIFWILGAVACGGTAVVAVLRSGQSWTGDFATAMWVTVSATIFVFLLIAAFAPKVWRLTPLLAAYMTALAVFAFAWQSVPASHPLTGGPSAWLVLHIGFAVATYALATIAAISALSGFLQERSLKRKQRPILDGILPSMTDSEHLIIRFLLMAEAVLALGLISGIALNVVSGLPFIELDHKTIFTFAAFAVIGILLVIQATMGLRGKRAARVVLTAYLLLTLGYLGVKFVSNVIIGQV